MSKIRNFVDVKMLPARAAVALSKPNYKLFKQLVKGKVSGTNIGNQVSWLVWFC